MMIDCTGMARPHQRGQVIEVQHPGNTVLAQCAGDLRKAWCSAALEIWRREVLPDERLFQVRQPGGIHAHAPEKAGGTDTALAPAPLPRHLPALLPARS